MTIQEVTLDSGIEYELQAGEEWVVPDPETEDEALALELLDAATDGVQFEILNRPFTAFMKEESMHIVDIPTDEFIEMAANGEIVPLQKPA